MTKKRILIADDHSAIRTGVKNILSAAFTGVEFGEAKNIAEAMGQIASAHWDCMILDIDFQGRNGFEVLKFIRDEKSKIPILVFSFHREDQIALRAIRSGASGYLSKDVTDQELITAVKEVIAGRKYITKSLSEQLVNHLQNPDETPPHEHLSGREFQTLLFIAKGRSIAEIATELNLSISTIHTYRSRLLEKLMVKNNAELTNYAFRFNLL
jgi:two-component system, NarL family, invasion response regulator UvrY